MRDTTAFGCVSTTIRLRSGLYLDLDSPQPEQFTFGDIAGALSKICRFGGQIDRYYSVAEHLCHCTVQARIDGLPLVTQRAVLLHDAAEAFIGDVVKPLKIMLRDYQPIEYAMEKVIAAKFGVDFDVETEAVRKIGREMLIAERRALFSTDNVKWTGEDAVRPITIQFECWDPKTAEENYWASALTLGIDTGD